MSVASPAATAMKTGPSADEARPPAAPLAFVPLMVVPLPLLLPEVELPDEAVPLEAGALRAGVPAVAFVLLALDTGADTPVVPVDAAVDAAADAATDEEPAAAELPVASAHPSVISDVVSSAVA